ncbi:MAG: 2-dehydropantoate 2-reductase [Chloroflexota bacterium]
MRVAMIGAGGLGGVYGGLLARAGIDVTFIARGRNLEAIRADGLTLSLASGEVARLTVSATDDPRSVGPVDLVWFCVKTYDLDEAARAALPLVGRDTMALPIQNGVEAHERLAAVLGAEHVLAGVGRAGGTLVAPGQVVQKSAEATVVFGEVQGGTSDRVQRLERLLRSADIDARLSTNVLVNLWDKFVQACAIFGLDTLLRLPEASWIRCPETAELFRGIMGEVYAVGRARGVDLPPDTPERLWTTIQQMYAANPGMHSSMYYDILAGRRLEIDAACGTVARLGRELGVPTPLNFAVYAALKPFAEGRA